MRIDSAGNVGIGVSDPGDYDSRAERLVVGENADTGITIAGGSSSDCRLVFAVIDQTDLSNGAIGYDQSADSMAFETAGSEAMRIDSSGRVLLQHSTSIANASLDDLEIGSGSGNTGMTIYSGTSGFGGIAFADGNTGASDQYPGLIEFSHSANSMQFYTANTERMRILSGGTVVFGKTSDDFGTAGVRIEAAGSMAATGANTNPMALNRLTSDGILNAFFQDGSLEGNISVSGSSVTYNGFTGTHETSGIASDTPIGTVCSTIDELDTYISGTKEGQNRSDHAKIKVSDAEGDSRVYGVLSKFDIEIDNKPIVASVGIGSILVTGSCVGGDLLESNGDGTAKVQDDDIIRSKTIGKVTIGNSNTDVKLVSCVLYCG
jgi:hypothetical protein